MSIDYSSNCGNVTSAIGPFAVDSGLVQRKEGMATVRIHNTNMGKIIYSTFPVVDGEAASSEGLRLMVWRDSCEDQAGVYQYSVSIGWPW